ncbi:MAG: WecB/TagA/CpsF family glycosyltransferase [Deltaproteobacteria bacterium]|nr:MAG: WecB/TagA/CpsF family glycosyltransferase [Deltaproteobacteria bacterium]TMQ13619.1 MAG: WecB/TagA/CpsF family glycosyltransferase [Deltaproteobacteria bacterium]
MVTACSIAPTVALGELLVSRLGLPAALAACEDRAGGAGGSACFVNVHTLTEASRDAELRDALRAASFLFADGVPLLWLARAKRAPIETRVCGPDFMDAMLRRQARQPHGLIGASPEVTQAVAERYGIAAVVHSPPVRPFSEAHALEDWQTFVARCPDGRPPRLVWIGLGAPKQERWIAAVSRAVPGVMFFGVGAAFDFLAGNKPRAPRLLRRAGLEWTHRLASEPRRLWKRYLVANARFAHLAARELIAARRS